MSRRIILLDLITVLILILIVLYFLLSSDSVNSTKSLLRVFSRSIK